jgi:hypothetical protein
MDRIELPLEPCHQGVPSGVSKMIFLSLWYVWHKQCTYLAPTLTLSANRLKQDSKWPTSPWSSIGCFQHDFWACGIFAQTVHLSCIKISSMSKWTESSFHLSLVTSEYHQVRPKWFLSLWYVRRKPCSYLLLTLTLPPNGLKRDSTRLWYIWRKLCTYLSPRLALSPNGLNQASIEPRHLAVPSSASKLIYEPIVCLVQTVHLSCTDTNTVSTCTKMRFHMTHVTS